MNPSTPKDPPRVESSWKDFVPEICALIVIAVGILFAITYRYVDKRMEAGVKKYQLVVPVSIDNDHTKFTLIRVDSKIARAIISTTEGKTLVAEFVNTIEYSHAFPKGLKTIVFRREVNRNVHELMYFVEKSTGYEYNPVHIPTCPVYLVLNNH
jgi:hypothetical protein